MTLIGSPRISVVVPVYKVEDYLRETLDSVLRQDIGFEDAIELILVNDGSPDNSGDICQEYAEKYPGNIVYVKQKNAGVSVARNNGLKKARGTYVHFLDSDDILQENAYSAALSLLTDHGDEIDFAALRLEFFDARLGVHLLDGKYTSDRVIDVNEEPQSIILHMGACIIRRDAIRHEFDASIKISEDMKFLTEILASKKRYGVIASARYYYRKRANETSAIDGSRKDPTFYTVTPERVYGAIIKAWTENDTVHPYVQNVVMYDLQWRLMQEKQTAISDEEERSYRDLIVSLLKKIDDNIILSQRHIKSSYVKYALAKKYDGLIPDGVYQKFKDKKRKVRPEVVLQFIRRHGNTIELEGYIQNNPLDVKIEAFCGDELLDMEDIDNVYAKQTFLGDVVDTRRPFIVSVPVAAVGGNISFRKANDRADLKIITRRRTRLANVIQGYARFGNTVLINKINYIELRSYTRTLHIFVELRWMVRIILALRLRASAIELRNILRSTKKDSISLSKKLHPFLLPPVSLIRNMGTVLYRVAYFVTKPFIRKEVWIVSDRTTAAGDNGEVLYDYITSQHNEKVLSRFAISGKSKDYTRLKGKGVRLVDSDKIFYKVLFLHASKIISSHADDHVVNPFSYRVEHLNDLYDFDFVFLQHGVIHNKDISSWLNRYNKDIKLFVTSAKTEYESILHYNYYYTPENVLLSGLPRYDLLKSEPKSKLVLAPTWRHWLAVEPDKNGVRTYSKKFKKTEYYQFYNDLMNDKRLMKVMRKHNMTGEFYLHPALESQSKDFIENDVFTMKEFPYDYKTAFREGSLLVTDYSSVLFDFVYLKKPVVYTQFDIETFNKGHTIYTKGDMDDAKDGFGPVTNGLDESVDAIIAIIESNCKMESKYRKRVDTFFAWHDTNNSKRVYDAIVNLKTRR